MLRDANNYNRWIDRPMSSRHSTHAWALIGGSGAGWAMFNRCACLHFCTDCLLSRRHQPPLEVIRTEPVSSQKTFRCVGRSRQSFRRHGVWSCMLSSITFLIISQTHPPFGQSQVALSITTACRCLEEARERRPASAVPLGCLSPLIVLFSPWPISVFSLLFSNRHRGNWCGGARRRTPNDQAGSLNGQDSFANDIAVRRVLIGRKRASNQWAGRRAHQEKYIFHARATSLTLLELVDSTAYRPIIIDIAVRHTVVALVGYHHARGEKQQH